MGRESEHRLQGTTLAVSSKPEEDDDVAQALMYGADDLRSSAERASTRGWENGHWLGNAVERWMQPRKVRGVQGAGIREDKCVTEGEEHGSRAPLRFLFLRYSNQCT